METPPYNPYTPQIKSQKYISKICISESIFKWKHCEKWRFPTGAKSKQAVQIFNSTLDTEEDILKSSARSTFVPSI